ncbi:MAG: hypothetical protein J6K86_00235 [Clostridia bacterium]|nr:hypothetical protein [Clostridia bacterium]
MDINAVINRCLGMDYRTLENFAGENYKKVYYHISEKHGGEKANTLLIGSIFTCVASDGKFSDGEWEFISKFIGGYSYDQALQVAGEFYCGEAQNITRDLLRIFPADVQEAFLCVCVAVLTVDKRLGDSEVGFLNYMLS